MELILQQQVQVLMSNLMSFSFPIFHTYQLSAYKHVGRMENFQALLFTAINAYPDTKSATKTTQETETIMQLRNCKYW
jgi:hypothetical protein